MNVSSTHWPAASTFPSVLSLVSCPSWTSASFPCEQVPAVEVDVVEDELADTDVEVVVVVDASPGEELMMGMRINPLRCWQL